MSRQRVRPRRQSQTSAYAGPALRNGQYVYVGGETYELTIPKAQVSDLEWAALIGEGWELDER